MKTTKQQIMIASNLRAKSEGRSQSLKKSHAASKGVFVPALGKRVQTLATRNRLESNYVAGDVVEVADVDVDDLDFAGMM